jgi:hypothetical protein
VDTQTNKVYVLGDLIAEGLLRATEVQAEVAKALLMQAELGVFDEIHGLRIRADKITVGGGAPGLVIAKPSNSHLWHFDTSLESTDGIKPLEGAVATLRPNEGRFGGAVAVEEGTVNLHPNPNDWTQFRANNPTTSPVEFQKYGVGGRIRRNPDFEGRSSNFSCYNILFYDAVEGEVYTHSLKVKPERDAWLSLDPAVGFVLCKAGEWTTLTRTITVSETGSRRVSGLYGNDTWGPDFNPWIEFKEYQVEQKPFATSFVDGTRAGGRLEYPAEVVPQNEGTIAGWFKMHPLGFAEYRYFWDSIGSRFAFYIRSSDKSLIARTNNSAERILGSLGSGFDETEWHQYALTWTGLGLNAYVDGELVGSYNGTIELPLNSGNVRFGTHRSGFDERSIGLFDELLILPYAATEEEIKAWYAMGAPFYDPSPVIPDSQIQSAETWNKAVHDAQRALADAADAQATADGKVTTYYQDTEPIAEALGDLWIHTGEDNKLYRWSGSSWDVVQDKKIQEAVQKAEDAQATADGKIVTFYQSTPPTATAVGDLWVDTDDNDRLYRWDGATWVDITDKSPVDAEKKPVYVKGAGADIEMDQYGIRATRKADNVETFRVDTETGDAFFRGDITGASGTFSGNLLANKVMAALAEFGEIVTDEITIKSADGRITIIGNTMEVKDENNVVRVRIGRLS